MPPFVIFGPWVEANSCWLVIAAAQGLVDTGAQTAVIGMRNFQRWMICLVLGFGYKPLFRPMPRNAGANGVGGQQKALALCEVPIGFCGINGIEYFIVIADPSEDNSCPPLLPNRLLIDLDTVIEPKHDRLTCRFSGTQASLTRLNSLHQTTSMLAFSGDGWDQPLKQMPQKYIDEGFTSNPFWYGVPHGREHLEPTR